MATVSKPGKGSDIKYDSLVAEQLLRAQRRIRLLDVATGVLGLLAATLLYAIVICLIGPRLSQTALTASLCVYGVAAMVYSAFLIVRPLTRRINPYFAARKIEEAAGGGAKNSVINWLDLHDDDRLPASVQQAVSQKAARDLEKVALEQAVSGKRAGWAGAIAGGCFAALLVMLISLGGAEMVYRLGRAFLPFRELLAPKKTSLTLVTPQNGDATIATRQAFEVRVRVEGRVPKPDAADALRLYFRATKSDPQLTRALEEDRRTGEWFVVLPPAEVLTTGFYYQVKGGDASTPEYRVEVRPDPELVHERFVVTYRMRPYFRKNFDRIQRYDRDRDGPLNIKEVRAIEDYAGTTVTVLAPTNARVKEGWLEIRGEPDDKGQRPTTIVPWEAVQGDDRAMRFRFPLDQKPGTYEYRIRFRPFEGPEYTDQAYFTLTVKPDAAPKVVITKPGDTRLPANGLLQAEGRATDDVGVKSMTLKMRVTAGMPNLPPDGIALADRPYNPAKGLQMPDGGYPVDVHYKDNIELGKLIDRRGDPFPLRAGMVLEYWLEASDECDFPHPNVGVSQRCKIVILEPEKDQEKLNQERQKAEQEKQKHQQEQEQRRQDEARKRQEQKQKEEKQNREQQEKQKEQEQKEKDRQREQEKKGNEKGEGDNSKDGKDQKDPAQEQREKELRDKEQRLKEAQERQKEEQRKKEQGQGKDDRDDHGKGKGENREQKSDPDPKNQQPQGAGKDNPDKNNKERENPGKDGGKEASKDQPQQNKGEPKNEGQKEPPPPKGNDKSENKPSDKDCKGKGEGKSSQDAQGQGKSSPDQKQPGQSGGKDTPREQQPKAGDAKGEGQKEQSHDKGGDKDARSSPPQGQQGQDQKQAQGKDQQPRDERAQGKGEGQKQQGLPPADKGGEKDAGKPPQQKTGQGKTGDPQKGKGQGKQEPKKPEKAAGKTGDKQEKGGDAKPAPKDPMPKENTPAEEKQADPKDTEKSARAKDDRLQGEKRDKPAREVQKEDVEDLLRDLNSKDPEKRKAAEKKLRDAAREAQNKEAREKAQEGIEKHQREKAPGTAKDKPKDPMKEQGQSKDSTGPDKQAQGKPEKKQGPLEDPGKGKNEPPSKDPMMDPMKDPPQNPTKDKGRGKEPPSEDIEGPERGPDSGGKSPTLPPERQPLPEAGKGSHQDKGGSLQLRDLEELEKMPPSERKKVLEKANLSEKDLADLKKWKKETASKPQPAGKPEETPTKPGKGLPTTGTSRVQGSGDARDLSGDRKSLAPIEIRDAYKEFLERLNEKKPKQK